ncbi:MAG: hypothetical protein ACE5GB_10240, partial [Acidimicrobiales bacterium]
METLAANGLTIEVPRGWEAELSALGRASDLDTAVPLVARPRVVLHAANFALPPDRGDYGSGATEVMDSGGVLVVLLEFDQAVVRVTGRLNERRITRGEAPIAWKYFQYLALLFTEIYLDRYF